MAAKRVVGEWKPHNGLWRTQLENGLYSYATVPPKGAFVRRPRKPMKGESAESFAYRVELAKAVLGPVESKPCKFRAAPGHGYTPAKKRLAWMLADPCAYCNGPADTWDHITPRKRGGDHSDSNLVRVCHPCNHEKTSRTLLTFLAIRATRKAAGTWKRLPASRLNSPSHA